MVSIVSKELHFDEELKKKEESIMINLEILEDKYIELLLKKCINFNQSKSLFINYDRVNKKFVEKVMIKAKEMGIYDI